MTKYILSLSLILLSLSAFAQKTVENIVLITLDGLRWQELYGGAVDSMMLNEKLVKKPETLMAKYSAPTPEEARKKTDALVLVQNR